MITGFHFLEKEICEKIKDELEKVGLLYRLFSRSKNDRSILEKIKRKEANGDPYCPSGKLIQDTIGVRIVTYFIDDINLVMEILKKKFNFIDSEIDSFDPTVFKPTRTNIICSLNEEQIRLFKEVQASGGRDHFNLLDTTFELQLRTILSEGWHEIDHSLRYKSKSDWEQYPENERLLNGIYASLETNDIALKNLFNELAYKHFKNKNWEGLIKNKFRIKLQSTSLKEELKGLFDNKAGLGKSFYKLDREELLLTIYQSDISLPVNINNLVFLANGLTFKDPDVTAVTPKPILKLLKNTPS